jgi:hypothetical protein
MAVAWWNSLDATERERWLDAAEADGRERSMLAAYTLMGDGENRLVVRNKINFDEGR